MKKMIKSTILQYFIVILIVPLYFLLTDHVYLPIFNLLLSILIFYLFFGYIVFKTLISLQAFPFLKNDSVVQSFAFSLLFGILLNTLYGIIAATILQIYPVRLYIFIYFEIIAIIYVVLDFIIKIKSDGKGPKFSTKDIPTLFILFLPTLIGILIIYKYSPYPYLVGWDIFYYQGITSDFLLGMKHYIYPEFTFQPAGFNFIQGNAVLLSNLPIYYLIEFNKIGVLFTNGLSVIWIYLICFRITKSRVCSIIPSLFISTFDGGIALGPAYFLPSSFSWQIGLGILYLLVSFHLFEENQQEIIAKRKNVRNLLVFSLIIIVLIFFTFIFHFLISLVIASSFLLFVIFRLKFFRNHAFLLIIVLGALVLMIGEFFASTSLFELLMSFLSNFVPLNNIPMWTYQKTFDYLFNEINGFISPIIGFLSIIAIIIKRKKQFYIFGFSFIFFFILLFSPLNAIYRITYIIFIYNAILFSILLSLLKEIPLSTLLMKYSKLSHLSNNIKTNEHFLKVKPFVLIFLVSWPVVHFQDYNYPKYTMNKIVNEDSDGFLYSAYSYQEFLAAKWLADNIDQNSSLLYTDPGSYALFPSLTGISYYGVSPPWLEEFRTNLWECEEDGPNTDLFVSVSVYFSRDIILIMTPRTHKWVQIQDQTGKEKGIIPISWINQTLLEYMDNDLAFEKLYENPEVTIYRFNS